MKFKLILVLVIISFRASFGQPEVLSYHDIKTDASGKIIPWFSPGPGTAYSYVIQSVWHFWDTMRVDMNGLPYYMNHQVWKAGVDDTRGIGGDQLQMALSSWLLLYQFTGDERIKENMKFIAGYYLTHGLSDASAKWPDIPYPYNTLIYSGIFDGDMVIGKDFTQPDKAGSFGLELIHLYKITGTKRHGQTPSGIYLSAAVNIANTLAGHMIEGDDIKSPLPFKVNAVTGETGKLLSNNGDGSVASRSDYTTNWSGTMELFLELIKMNKGNVSLYQHSFDNLLSWMKKYPLKNNKWGPFFEDVPGWSDTQINAVTFAQFMMNHQEYFPDWKNEVEGIFKWVYKTLENKTWEKYGVVVVNEQTAYLVPGNSHTSRQASAELQYVSLTGDTIRKQNAIRQLNWATYMVDYDGKNRYPQDENWLTDGYGDYVRHFLRAMGALPELAPSDEEHILFSSSVVQEVEYKNRTGAKYITGVDNPELKNIKLRYTTYDNNGIETIRLSDKPLKILIDGVPVSMSDNLTNNSYKWQPLKKGGVLRINRINGNEVTIMD
jgi:hypothetical protein